MNHHGYVIVSIRGALLWAGLLASHLLAAPELPRDFTATTVVENIDGATALTIAPDGRVFYAEQTGAIRVVKNDDLVPRPALDLSDRLDAWWERGLIGLTFHPDFPRTPHLFVVYVAKEPFTHHVVSRFTAVGDLIDPRSEMVLLEGDDQAGLGGNVPAGHQGGPICFGTDGMLYLGLGEQTAGKPSQSLDTLQGKILRLRPDGSIPEDNPFYGKTEGKYRAIYAIGIRNPFGLAVDPVTGRLFETDVGGSAFEEINEIVAGGNYGWPHAEGLSNNESFRNPLHAYPPAVGRSICGAMIYPRGGTFPERWHGKLFFADWANHWIKALDVDAPEDLIPFGAGFEAPVGIATAPDGSVYVLNRNTRWRDGKKYEKNSGSLVRIRYAPGSTPSRKEPEHPLTLAAAGVFEDVSALDPARGFHRFEMNAPMWRPGAQASRWIRLPANEVIEVTDDGLWRFPEGTVVVEHFDTEPGRRHETHVFRANPDKTWRAAAYRWTAEGSQADLVAHSEFVATGPFAAAPWLSPGPENALDPALSFAGFVLQLNAAQLKVDGQLQAWRARGWLDDGITDAAIASLPRLAPLDNPEAPLVHRVRSYLAANCAVCHRPGGPSRGAFDARITTPLAEQNLVNADPVAGDLGIAGAKLVVPGAPEKSVLLDRLKRRDAFRMPPGALHHLPSPVEPLMEEWIREMKAAQASAEDRTLGSVQLDSDAVDESADNLPAYKIITPTATYFLEKSGAGLSSLIDPDGNEWLGFHPKPGSGAAGEYRGFPNAVHRQGGSFFHARNRGTDPSDTRVVRNDSDRVVIAAEGRDSGWACRYEFTATHCTFTMTKMPAGRKYWVLYEGTPGGSYDRDDWWMTSAITERQPLTTKHDADIPAPEWIAFGDPRRRRALLLLHHADDQHPDRFYQMNDQMTVFGFGRAGLEKFLDSVPQSVTIALIEDGRHAALARAAERLEASAATRKE